MKNSLKFPLLPILLITVGVLLLIGAVLSAAFLRSPDSLSNPGAEGSYPEVTRVSLSQAKDAFDNGTAVFVDVRDSAYYESGHIPGAKSIPLGEIEQRRNELDPNDWIILYCT